MVVHAEQAQGTYLTGIQTEDLDAAWPQVEALLWKPLRRMGNDLDYHPSDILDECKAQRMQLWIVHDLDIILCAVVTEIANYPRRRVLRVVLTGAEPHTMDVWLSHIETIKAFAREHECSALRVNGRRGWSKVLSPDVVRTESEVAL